jgi:NAD(P)-dependent dehydrogenase (short-subunit alcohol dehydrogenase family)
MNSQMESFAGKLAVVTGGGSGMGRALVCQLAAQGCSVAACDWHPDAVAETASLARAGAGSGVLVTSHACDVSDEAQVLRFRDELLGQHTSDHVDLVFANAGIGGAGSFINDSRAEWEHTFAVDWWGVYHCARTFLPLLIASGDGVLVNTSSVNGLWAALGPGMPNTAYSAAKFAVRGFTEALIEDLRSNAPQVRVAVVMPGHVGTDIIGNTLRAHGKDPRQPRGRLRLRRAVPRAGAVMNRKACSIGGSLLLAAGLAVSGCGSSDSTSATSACPTKTGKAVTASSPVAATGKPAAGWTLPGADLANTRDVASAITSTNVSRLGVAWTVPLHTDVSHTDGAYATTPVIVNGVVYVQDLQSNVMGSAWPPARCCGRTPTTRPTAARTGSTWSAGWSTGLRTTPRSRWTRPPARRCGAGR